MVFIYDKINWSTYEVSGIGNITERRWYDHEIDLPVFQHDDGYIYKAVAKPKLSNPEPGDDMNYEYVDIEITYDFDFLGTYNTDKYTNKLDKIIAKRNSKGLPITNQGRRSKGEPRPNTSAEAEKTAVKTAIHGNNMVSPQMQSMGITKNNIQEGQSLDRGVVEDAATVVLTVGNGIFSHLDNVFSGQASTYFKASEAAYKDFSPLLNQVIDTTVKQLQDNEQLFQNIEKTIENSYHNPNGPSVEELKAYNNKMKVARAEQIQKAVTDGADECLKKGGAFQKEGSLALQKGKFFSVAGKVLERAGFVIMFGEVFYSYYESIDGNHDKFIDSVYSLAINIGVAVVAEIGAGAAAGATAGAAGGPAGILVGVIVGVVVALIDAAVLLLTKESLGHWVRVGINKVCEGFDYVMTEITKAVAPKAQPAMSNAIREMTTVAPGFSWWDIIRSMGGGF